MPRHLKLNSHNLLINISIQPRDCSLNALLANAARIAAYSVSRRVHAPSLKHERPSNTPPYAEPMLRGCRRTRRPEARNPVNDSGSAMAY